MSEIAGLTEFASLPGLVALIPIVAGLLLLALRDVNAAAWLNIASAAAALALAVILPWHLGHGGFLLVDPLSVHLALLTASVGLSAAWFSRDYIAAEISAGRLDAPRARLYFALFQAMLGFLLLAMLSNNLGVTWGGMEAATIAGVLVVGLPRTEAAVEASWKYFIICGVGIALALFGTIVLYLAAQAVLGPGLEAMSWTALPAAAPRLHAPLLNLAFVFLLVGYGTKAGLAPLHAWMPDAHAEGPTPVSAVLAGSVLNVALGVLLRLRDVLGRNAGAIPPGWPLLLLGLASVLLASFSLWPRRDVKRFFSFSTIEQNGLVAFAFGLGGPAIFAGLLHMTVHTLCKAAVFQCVGRACQLKGGQQFQDITGLISRHRALGLTLAAGILAVAGLPPFGLFSSEFLVVVATARQSPWLLTPLGLGMLVGIWALLWRMIALCLGEPSPDRGPAPHWSALAPAWAQLAVAVILGFAMPAPVFAWFQAIATGAGG